MHHFLVAAISVCLDSTRLRLGKRWRRCTCMHPSPRDQGRSRRKWISFRFLIWKCPWCNSGDYQTWVFYTKKLILSLVIPTYLPDGEYRRNMLDGFDDGLGTLRNSILLEEVGGSTLDIVGKAPWSLQSGTGNSSFASEFVSLTGADCLHDEARNNSWPWLSAILLDTSIKTKRFTS